MSLDTIYRNASVAADRIAIHARSYSPPAQRDAGLASGGIALDAMNTSPLAILTDGNAQGQDYQWFRGWVYSSVRPICQAIAGQALRVAVEPGIRSLSIDDPKERMRRMFAARNAPRYLKSAAENLQVYEQHPILDLLEDPNPALTGWAVWYSTVASLELVGEAYWWITRENGQARLWPLPKSWVAPVHDKKKGAFSGWAITPRGTGQPIVRPAHEVVYFSYPDPGDPLGSVSPLAANRRAVLADEAMQTAQEVTFKNGVHPTLALIVGDITDEDGEDEGKPLLEREQRQQIHAAVRQYYGGVHKYGEPLLLDALIKDVPTVAEFNARSVASAVYATAASITAHDAKLDTVTGLAQDVKAITDDLGTMIEEVL